MIRLFDKKIPVSPLFRGLTDFHCHILPGVDDGVKSEEESLSILDAYEKAGFSDVWFTPHVMDDTPNTTGYLKEVFDGFSAKYKGGLKLHLASENMIDGLFSNRLEKGDFLTIGDRFLLVETSCYTEAYDLEEKLSKIKEKGFSPVLAHPERYKYMTRDLYQHIYNSGVSFQLNLPALTGEFGADSKKRSAWLLENDLYSFVGSDLHGESGLKSLLDMKLPSRQYDMLEELIARYINNN